MQLLINTYLKSFDLKNNDNLFGDLNKNSNENTSTKIDFYKNDLISVPKYINEFWTAKQRQANSIHEISYRACFKPQLPKYFIELLTKEKD